MERRQFLLTTMAMTALPLPGMANGLASSGLQQAIIGASWRGPIEGSTHYAGALEVDWVSKKMRIRYALALPTRPHGLTPEDDGGMLIVAIRPGRWLLRCDAAGKVMQQIDISDEKSNCLLNGHAIASADGQLLFTTETDAVSGKGKVGVRDRKTLRKIAEWDSHGLEPHQLLLDKEGQLVVANGGIPRTASDKKMALDKIDSSIVRLDAANGNLLGHWQLADRRLSLRHISWNTGEEAMTHLGIAMQAQHDNTADRAKAPLLAVWDGKQLQVPSYDNDAIGYAGDIAPSMNGGFTVSSNSAGKALLWHPHWPEKLTTIAELDEPYALTAWHGPEQGGGVLIATALGVARWHPTAKPALLIWPEPMVINNHWTLLAES